MSTAVHFHVVDVFADAPLTGNPLALVPDAEHLTDAQMRAIAQEFNLSETTFLVPPTRPGAAHQLRSFTPGGVEVGAPGTTRWAPGCGWPDPAGSPRTPGTSSSRSATPPCRWRSAATAPGYWSPWTSRHHSSASTPPTRTHWPEHWASTPRRWRRTTPRRWCRPALGTCSSASATVRATGTAAGPLVAMLVARGVLADGCEAVVEQGYAIGRPSRLRVTVAGSRVRLTGTGVLVADGTLYL